MICGEVVILKRAATRADSDSRSLGGDAEKCGIFIGKLIAGIFVYADTVSERDVGIVAGLTGASVTRGVLVVPEDDLFCKSRYPNKQTATRSIRNNIFLFLVIFYGHPGGS